ncbi:TonB-dependent receptor, partial [bacterium]|nr:TonB-dependent receptor [bacterium]
DPDNKGREIVEVCEITMRNLVRSRKAGIEDFLDRVDCMGALKRTVMVTNIFRFHRLSQYLTQRTKGSVGFVIGVPLLSKMLEEQFYSDLPGGILEAMGRLFLPGVKLLVHPGYDPANGAFVTGHTLTVPEPTREVYKFLVRTGRIVDLGGTEKDLPQCSSSEILRNIRSGKKGWEQNVPAPVANLIRRRRLLGYRATRG